MSEASRLHLIFLFSFSCMSPSSHTFSALARFQEKEIQRADIRILYHFKTGEGERAENMRFF